MIDWHFMLLNKNVHEQVSTFNTTWMNIFSNYSQTILKLFPVNISLLMIKTAPPPPVDDRGAIKNKINLKKSLSRSKNFIGLQNLAIEIVELNSIRKEEYYNNLSKKLNYNNLSKDFNDPNTSVKTYWLILKSFYKGNMVP